MKALPVLALLALFTPRPGYSATITDCSRLSQLQLSHGAVTEASLVTSGAFTPLGGAQLTGLPPFCRVAATLKPTSESNIRIEIWLPQTAWNGRLEGTGNGGFAGQIAYGSLAGGLRAGYAVANTDMGLATPPGSDASTFADRPARWADWGYRATHDMTVAAKQVVKAYYGRNQKRAYFSGCSTGGEQALMEAQRFPADYDGIVGGAPANNRTGVHVSVLWNFMATRRATDSYIPAVKLPSLTRAVLSACDNLDGVKDGLISDPRRCAFDPSTLLCKGADMRSCLTPAQVETARRLYSGPVNPRTGTQVYPGLPPGTEFGWDHLGDPPGTQATPPYAPIFKWAFGLDWDWHSFDFDRADTVFVHKLQDVVDATSPNLDAFRARRHKLLIYHGWADWLVAPGESLNYYSAVSTYYKRRGAAANIDDFYRLFMVPGMAHCSGGPGLDSFDALSAVVKWVEQDVAPDTLLATKKPSKDQPNAVAPVRPLCPHPQVAQYKGTGDSNDPANFACSVPAL
jgi:feruloyl esterase